MADIFAQAFTDILEAMSDIDDDVQTVTYTPAVGDSVSCLVHIRKETLMQPGSFEAQIYGQETTVEGLLSVFGKEPDRGETFTTVGGTVYTVQSVLENDNRIVKAVVK